VTVLLEITIDRLDDVAYITMSDKRVVRTVELQPDVLVDLDEMNVVVGVEVLSLDAVMPFQRLIDEFHVHSGVVDLLRLVRPSVGSFTARTGETSMREAVGDHSASHQSA